mgnify:CR=1 FL=1
MRPTCEHCGNRFCSCQADAFQFRVTDDRTELVEPKARARDPETSKEAGRSMAETAAAQRKMILAYLETHGPTTCDALDEALGLRVISAGRRMSEMGTLVRRTGEKAMTRSGRPADLWDVRRRPDA